MKKYLFFAFILFALSSFAQIPYNTAAPNGYAKKAMVSEQVGLTQVSITYYRPAVKGREGKIWGGIIHKGFIDQGFGNGKPSPWRAGACACSSHISWFGLFCIDDGRLNIG